MFDIGLVVIAWKMPREAQRLLGSYEEHENQNHSSIVHTVTELDAPNMDPVDFNLAALKNIGLRTLIPQCEIVACTDADYMIPPGLLDWLVENTHNRHIHALRRDIAEDDVTSRTWMRWLKNPTRDHCWGSFNVMSSINWRLIGGWDERAYGWGGEDDLLHMRVERFGIEKVTTKEFPLMHIRHDHRPFRAKNVRSNENMKLAKSEQPNYLGGLPE
jgi:hypothetical protein